LRPVQFLLATAGTVAWCKIALFSAHRAAGVGYANLQVCSDALIGIAGRSCTSMFEMSSTPR